MMTLDLSKVPPEQWGDSVFSALATINAERAAAATDADTIRRYQIQQLYSRERGLIVALKDVRERIVMLKTG